MYRSRDPSQTTHTTAEMTLMVGDLAAITKSISDAIIDLHTAHALCSFAELNRELKQIGVHLDSKLFDSGAVYDSIVFDTPLTLSVFTDLLALYHRLQTDDRERRDTYGDITDYLYDHGYQDLVVVKGKLCRTVPLA